MNHSVKCSVLMCVYGGDAAAVVAESLDSLLAQTRMPDEIVLVEDGPLPDALAAVIGERAGRHPQHFKIHRLDANAGLIAALNAGLSLCSGELLFRMDADDVAHSERIARQAAFMEAHPEVGVLGTAMEEFSVSPDKPLRVKPVRETDRQIRRQLPWRNPINHPTACVRRALIPASGYPSLRYLEDYFLWAMLMANSVRFHNLNAPLLSYRFDDRTLQRRSGWLNFRNEVWLRVWMYRHGLASLPVLAAAVAIQVVLRFSPLAIRRRIWISARRRLRRSGPGGP